ncbi:MAG TPA: 1-acyl-sn-glycerol-3-phosphate acyltransferase [Polyangiaceae bacterium]|nr:1-acyl-sn-glycerol-3-phosphate acyltransferase [Polyangiaceae bacterium]
MSDRELTRTYEPNPVLRAVYRPFFDKIHVDEAWVAAVRDLAARGSVIYVLRNLNFVDFLALDYLTKRYGLPQVRFVNDLGLWILNPLGKGWLNALLPKRFTPSEELEDALGRGGSAALFLKRPPGLVDAVATGRTSSARGRKTEGDELVRALFGLQARHDRPIFLVPQVFVWSRFPDTRGTEPFDFLLGPREWPSPTRTIAQFFYNSRHVELKLGEPIDLRAFLADANGLSEAVLVRRLTYAVLRRLERERRSVIGPAEKAPERVRQEIVRSPRLRGVIDDLVDDRTDRHTLEVRAHAMLSELQATPARGTIKALEVLFDRVFERIYAGVEWEKADIDRLRAAARDGTLVLLPSHKSHVDYLILSYVFNQQNLPLPLIAAGDNLNFFPVGRIFRRGGAFFIRRSFRGDRLYAAVVDAYVRRLLRDGYPIEVFLEGGRSRTGKLLPPKLGLLSMVVDAALAVPERPTLFVPVSIGYEQVIESKSYERELSGGEKAKEDAAGLLKSRDLLRHRYGRISMQVGQVLTLNDIAEELGAQKDAPLSPAKRRAVVTRLGNRVMDEINRVTAVTPGSLTALVLLTHRQRGLSHEELLTRAERLLGVLRGLGARTSPALRTDTGALRRESIREAVQMFADTELVEIHLPAQDNGTRRRDVLAGSGAHYVVPESKRLSLDTSKNVIVHFFVERALVALALLSSSTTELVAVRERVRALSRLFKFEFRFRADSPFEAIFEDTCRSMAETGELDTSAGACAPGPGHDGLTGRDWLELYAGILVSFVDGYRVAARALVLLERSALPEKELVRKALAIGGEMFLAGAIERREAVSKPMLKNAFQAFVDHGFLLHRDDFQLTPDHASAEAVRAIEQTIAGYLPERPA